MAARSTLWAGCLLLTVATALSQEAPPGYSIVVPSAGWHGVADRGGESGAAAGDPRYSALDSRSAAAGVVPAGGVLPGSGGVYPAAATSLAPSPSRPVAPLGMVATPATNPAGAPAPASPRRPIARVTEGITALPNTQGQVWREYDISPYTMRVTSTKRPEQAIVDWILRETGYEAWHGEPLAILSASKNALRVYHTPAMHAVVAEIVDRFVAGEAESKAFGLRVVTLDEPNWRSRSYRLLRPVTTHTPGVHAWLLRREDATMLLADLKRHNDYREYTAPHLLVNNGQSAVVSALRARPYVRDVALRSDAVMGYQPETAQVDEGFSLEFSPLLSLDGRLLDATIKCDIDQVEKLIPVAIDVPTVASPRQSTNLDVPQLLHNRFHERFRWPVDQVLLVNLGMVAMPPPPGGGSLMQNIPFIGTTAGRADLLVFVEPSDETAPASARLTQAPPPAASYSSPGSFAPPGSALPPR